MHSIVAIIVKSCEYDAEKYAYSYILNFENLPNCRECVFIKFNALYVPE